MGLLFSVALLLFASFGQAQAAICDAEAPCEIEDGSYHLAFPPAWDGKTVLPAILFFHGHRSSGLSALKSGSIRTQFLEHGYLVIAPNGEFLPGTEARAWPARPLGGDSRDDVAFTLKVMADVASKVPLQQDRVLVSGFSAGGSMVWMMACYEGARFAAFAPVSGALRRPVPDQICPGGPVRLLHIHGFADRQVPLEGRAIRDWHQGDVFSSLSLARETGQCASLPDEISFEDGYRCRHWRSCNLEAELQLCLHDKGHMMPKGWAEKARIWFESK